MSLIYQKVYLNRKLKLTTTTEFSLRDSSPWPSNVLSCGLSDRETEIDYVVVVIDTATGDSIRALYPWQVPIDESITCWTRI